jgi:hypothetical protein
MGKLMSGIRVKIEITENEKKAIQTQHTLYPAETGTIVHQDKMNQKILLCILECMQDIKQELTEMRQTNERMASKIERSFTGDSVRVYRTN